MCGIGGAALRPGASMPLAPVLERMAAVQHHRGPDGRGTWMAADGSIGLCHNRLAILDLSPAGAQPMHSRDGRYTVVFNGEIYNWQELRSRLEATGIGFFSDTDTEVLIEAYRAYGLDVLQHLRGMFAFALYDAREQTLLCARDRLGKKPFVYAQTPEGVAFASEIPAVLAMPGCDTGIDHSALAAMLLHNLRHVPDPRTVYRGLKRLRPGHAMLIREGRIERQWRYWTPTPAVGPTTPQRLRDVLEEAVQLRTVADVPVGALLSGGVDSSAIVALMTRLTGHPIRTYALGLDENDEDLRRARAMARQLGCVHREFHFEPQRQLDVFRDMLRVYGEPIMLLPLVHTHELCRGIRDDGVKVVLAGHGADELFYGYTGHVRTAAVSSALSRLGLLRHAAALLPASRRRGALGLLASRPGRRKAHYYRSLEAGTWAGLVRPEARAALTNVAAEEMDYWGQLVPSSEFIDESNFVALMVENSHSVTIAADLPAMMNSVEMRAPFLDQAIVEFALATPYRAKVGRDASRLKQILKRAVEDLVPHDLLYAPKRGFGMGIQETAVFRGAWAGAAEAAFEAPDDLDGLLDSAGIRHLWQKFRRGEAVPASTIAKLFAIQQWCAEPRQASPDTRNSDAAE